MNDSKISHTSICRFCGHPLSHTLVDLGVSPLCESFLSADQLSQGEMFYPLQVKICDRCFLVQLDQYVDVKQIFSEYAYFASFSESWLRHAADFAGMAVDRFGLGPGSFVVELGSNDGYLLKNFAARRIPCLGIDPAANVVRAAEKAGVPSLVKFFGVAAAKQMVAAGQAADLIIGNNVLAQVPDLNDFVGGIRILLKPSGVASLEFPHLMRLLEQCQYDTIYHEHFSYFSWIAAEKIFAAHGLTLFDLEELPTHGGSLRIFACHAAAGRSVTSRAIGMRKRELDAGYDRMEAYAGFSARVAESKRALLEALIRIRREGKTVACYGAPGKGNTLLNHCGIGKDFIDYTVDRNPWKHGRFLPGTHIPVYPVGKIYETRPDYVLILAWNVATEIMNQIGGIRAWGGKFMIPVPAVAVFD